MIQSWPWLQRAMRDSSIYFVLDQTCIYIHNQQQYNDKVLLKYALEYISCEVSVVVFIIFCICFTTRKILGDSSKY